MNIDEVRAVLRPSYSDEYIEKLAKETEKIENIENHRLLLLSLAAIMEEQQRTADRSPGWPTLEHDALRLITKKRSGK